MNNRHIKNALKDAYQVEQTESRKAFIEKYEKRNLQILEILKIEFRYMGMKSMLAGILLCLVLYYISKSGNDYLMWGLSSVLPIFVLLLVTLIGKSERHGMCELEAASRFSFRFIRMIRMLILGVFSMIFIFIASVSLKNTINTNMIETFSFIGCPYFLNVGGCIFITRKWHSKENIYGCAGLTLFSCLLPFIADKTEFLSKVDSRYMLIALIALILLTVKESILYIRESEEVAWNLY